MLKVRIHIHEKVGTSTGHSSARTKLLDKSSDNGLELTGIFGTSPLHMITGPYHISYNIMLQHQLQATRLSNTPKDGTLQGYSIIVYNFNKQSDTLTKTTVIFKQI
ncbi:hypothetical protein VNO77_21820 [Canavalia gladiata]|uniref:Uncharacterized protein n=1 Tax=Canavalia gladiata TaxID=3824 RepID=A0AAN9L2W6_CANGL